MHCVVCYMLDCVCTMLVKCVMQKCENAGAVAVQVIAGPGLRVGRDRSAMRSRSAPGCACGVRGALTAGEAGVAGGRSGLLWRTALGHTTHGSTRDEGKLGQRVYY